MPSLLSTDTRQGLLTRLDQLTPDTVPLWGRMTAPQVLAHLSDSMRMAFGELSVAPRWLPIRYPLLKQLIVYLVPFPKGAPTAPELLARQPEAWDVERRQLGALIQRCGTLPSDFRWPPHPAFGPLSRRAWGILGYRHIDHHLRQFGV